MAKLNFNTEEHEEMMDFSPIPEGWYLVMASESEMKDTRSGTGEYLQIQFDVVDGEQEGKKLWSRLNVINDNDQAVKIANSELKSICTAIEFTGKLKDSEKLHNKPLWVKVVLEERNDKPGEMTNRIKNYMSKAKYQKEIGDNGTPEDGEEEAPWDK